MRRIYDGLGVSQDLTFCELNPDGYDHIVIGDKRVDFPKGKENLIERLKGHFPHEAKGIDCYFADLTNMMESLSKHWQIEQSAESGGECAVHSQVDARHGRGLDQRARQRPGVARRAGGAVGRSWNAAVEGLGVHARGHHASLFQRRILSAGRGVRDCRAHSFGR